MWKAMWAGRLCLGCLSPMTGTKGWPVIPGQVNGHTCFSPAREIQNLVLLFQIFL